MKKFIMLIAMALTLCATNKAEAYDFSAVNADGKTIYYNISGTSNVMVVFNGIGEYTGIINIPSTVTYNGTTYSVTKIGTNAFYGCSDLTSVTIPNSDTSIGK